MNNEVKNVSRNPESCEVELTVTSDVKAPISPEILADAFWHMDEEQQCGFLNRLGFIEDSLPLQLQSVISCGQLDTNGRYVMQLFGEYGNFDDRIAQRAKGDMAEELDCSVRSWEHMRKCWQTVSEKSPELAGWARDQIVLCEIRIAEHLKPLMKARGE